MVVTNTFSDWSTQPWPASAARLRVHKINQGEVSVQHTVLSFALPFDASVFVSISVGSSVVIEACELGSDDFVFIRIAHLSSLSVHLNSPRYDLSHSPAETGPGRDWQIGPYAASPMAQKGCVARFYGLEFGPRKESVHSADVSEMTDKGKR